ncbi:MAG: ABC transporter permease [Gammaproteobacteria bacterium]
MSRTPGGTADDKVPTSPPRNGQVKRDDEPIIELQEVSRIYSLGGAETPALKQVSFKIARGEFVAITGPSGSGKTTLMNIIGCLDRPTAGRYLLQGKDVSTLSEPELADARNTQLGFVFQNFNLLARTSAVENVALPLVYAGTARAGMQRARELLAVVGLADRARHTSAQLSGGQQQRVAIARALANDPAIILADEPTGQLDTHNSAEIMAMLRELNHSRRLTVVVVTHDPTIAAQADRTITFRDGQMGSDTRNPVPTAASVVSLPWDRMTRLKPGSSVVQRMKDLFMMTLQTAARALVRNKLRSALTVLGIFIGVVAFITMVAVGHGAQQAVAKQLQALGTNMVIVLPGAIKQFGASGGAGTSATLTVDDARAISREDPAVLHVSYLIRQSGAVTYRSRNWTTTIQGISPSYLAVRSWPLAAGREIDHQDELDARRVCVIGQTVVQQLFPTGVSPLGKVIQVRGVPLRVIGILTALGQTGFGQDQDDIVLVPYTTAQEVVLGPSRVAPLPPISIPPGTHFIVPADLPQNLYANLHANALNLTPRIDNVVSILLVQARSAALIQPVIRQVTTTLREQHHLRPGTVDDFSVRNLSQIVQVRESSSRILTLLLAAVAAISLIVGGIGIMNILLVSVTERTREIGVRKAVGAHQSYILMQFLVEAFLLAAVGGLAGIAFGIAVSALMARALHWETYISPEAVIFSLLFSGAVGVFFGFYPARKAARLDTIEALRYE